MTAERFDSRYDKPELTEALENGIVNIFLHKMDGNKTTIRVTLDEDHIPDSAGPDPYAVATAADDDAHSVYDVRRDRWRSFKWKNIISWNTGD